MFLIMRKDQCQRKVGGLLFTKVIFSTNVRGLSMHSEGMNQIKTKANNTEIVSILRCFVVFRRIIERIAVLITNVFASQNAKYSVEHFAKFIHCRLLGVEINELILCHSSCRIIFHYLIFQCYWIVNRQSRQRFAITHTLYLQWLCHEIELSFQVCSHENCFRWW